MAPMRRLFVLVGCAVTGAFAEIVDLGQILMPGKQELNAYYLFQVYTNAIGPTVNQIASVTFKNFEIKWSNGQVGIGDYKSLQISLIPFSKFSTLIDKTNFCSAERKVTFTGVATGIPVFNVGSSQNATFLIMATDAYLLIVTNCGDRSGATATKGEVIVKQAHGYLPGNKIGTLQWWGGFAMINAFLCIKWAVASARHYKALVYVQKVIAALAALAFLEAAAAYGQYREWNDTGTESMALLAATMFFYSLKYVLTVRMLAETAAGYGELQLNMACFVFLMVHWTWKVILSYKYHLINPTFSVAITIPGTVLWLVLFIWVYRKFHALLLTLLDNAPAPENMMVVMNMRMVLVGSMLLAVGVLGLQFADIVLSNTPWNLQWVVYDAAPHTVYTLFLLAMMVLWWPHADSWKLGYSNQVNQDEHQARGDGNVHAEQIGAAEAEELEEFQLTEQIGTAEAEEL